MTAQRRPLWRQLHVRAALVALLMLAMLSATVFALVRYNTHQSGLESSQRMSLGLARYVVERQSAALIGPGGAPNGARMNELAMYVMMVNPAVEVYLLDQRGRIVAHALENLTGDDPVGRHVDLQPVRKLAGAPTDTLRLPVFGDDPRTPGRRCVISVAPIRAGGELSGYLYIVLNGSAQQGVTASLDNSDTLRATAASLVLVTLLAAAVLVLALRKLTRPLRQLTAELEAFRSESRSAGEPTPGDEIGVLRSAVHSMQQRIASQFKRLDDSDSQRRELISNISHDLRTPLSSIQGYVETVLLRGEQLDAHARATHLRTALRHVELLGKRIADLFELSKLDAGRVEPKVEVFCLAELLQDVVQNYQLSALQRSVRLQLAAGSQTIARVAADIALIERVLQNLVDNALRFTAAGGAVTVALNERGSQLEISVSDTGRGIAQEHLPHIFDRYWHAADAEGTDSGPSSGLGLAIVKRILELHGSAVRVHSELRRGTRIEFMLPQVA